MARTKLRRPSPSSDSVADTPTPHSRITISVVIPSYDGAAYIRDTIGSILQQTVLPDEIIVVDDCSRDGTVTTVQDLARTAAAPIHVLRMRRNSGGPAKPINAGVEAATSDLIAVLEQDDRLTPIRIARSLEAAKLLPSAGLICGRVRMKSSTGSVRDDLWKDGRLQFADLSLTPIAPSIYRAESADLLLALLQRNIVFTNSNAVFPRSIWKRVGGFDPKYPICADLDFNLKVARVSPFVVIDDVLCEYHQRQDSLYNRNVALAGHSPAHLEAAFIRMRHALQHYGSSSEVADEWYWEGRYLLRSAWKRHDWKRGYNILRALCSSGALRNHAIKKLRRMVVFP
jgi:glycosyltransferase involved in cell wall biosynthesis